MDTKKMQDSALKEQTPSICSQLNLDIEKLNVQKLMLNPTYRRLYNIVKNDMSRSQLSFRKNLIKELYFLLQIAPIIRAELLDNFLAELQKLYNLNDHKKIDLASNKLNDLLNIVHAKKDNCERPKSGVSWNQNISPFLRPYTAKRSQSSNNKKLSRPESSKFGQRSTKGDTAQDFCIREFTTNTEEQIQISQDFLQRHRTAHPQIEPFYQQLYNILKKIQAPSSQEPVVVGRSLAPKAARYAKSAFSRKQPRAKQVAIQSQQNITNEAQRQNLKIDEDSQQKQEKQSEDSINSEQQEYLFVNHKKPYRAFIQTAKQTNNSSNLPIQKIKHLQKYDHLMTNKLVQALKEDCEMAEKYVHFARTKSAIRREHNRRNECRRLMSAKITTSSAAKFSKKDIPVLPEQQDQNQNKCQSQVKFVDLTKDSMNLKIDQINAYPTYNKRQLLKRLYEEPASLYKKRNRIDEVPTNVKGNVARPMTSFVRFHSPVRFDPMSDQNVKKYNQQIMEEIEKIKIKVGGKCYASTDSLMKALLVNVPQKEQLPKWQTKNPYFGLNSIGKGKKLKKKGKIIKNKTTISKK